jgi:hypothetical protein
MSDSNSRLPPELMMKLHQEVTLRSDIDSDAAWIVMRVFNGWIYTYHNDRNPNLGHSVFVPMEVDFTSLTQWGPIDADD